MRKHFFNESYFNSIDTEDKAYWLGFIAADGNVQFTAKNKCLSIGLKFSDKTHLEKFALCLNYNGPISTNRTIAKITLYSAQLTKDLATHGILPRKSFNVKPWSGSPYLLKHYWRGVFDGDGG